MHHREHTRAGPAATTLALAAALALLGGCAPERPSAEGESCRRTADCAEPLRCVALTCVTPARAAHLRDARGAPDGTGGAPSARSTAPPAPLGRGLAPTTPAPAGAPPAPPAPPEPDSEAPPHPERRPPSKADDSLPSF